MHLCLYNRREAVLGQRCADMRAESYRDERLRYVGNGCGLFWNYAYLRYGEWCCAVRWVYARGHLWCGWQADSCVLHRCSFMHYDKSVWYEDVLLPLVQQRLLRLV